MIKFLLIVVAIIFLIFTAIGAELGQITKKEKGKNFISLCSFVCAICSLTSLFIFCMIII